MGTVAHPAQVKIDKEGRVRRGALADLLGRLGLVRATCLLDIKARKLVRRFVLSEGRIEALISNAREDRFAEWLATREETKGLEATRKVRALLERAADHPLTGHFAVECGLETPATVAERLREHLMDVIAETAGWSEAAYDITPGRVDLKREPAAGLEALDAALSLARDTSRQRAAGLPAGVVARPGAAEALERLQTLSDDERLIVQGAAEPVRPAELLEALGAERRIAAGAALSSLLRAGLLAATPAPVERVESPAEEARARGAVTVQELERWLKAGEDERFEELLGVGAGAPPDAVRRAYYQTVRRFHPDHFREGPLAAYHGRVEACFRLVNEALQLLTDPRARQERERRRQTAMGPDPTSIATKLLDAARKAVGRGQLTHALRFLEQVVSQHGRTPEHAVPLALLLMSNPRRRAEAVSLLESLASAHPGHGEVAAALALAYQKSGEQDKAGPLIARAARLAPRSAILALARGDADAASRAGDDPFLATLA